MTREPVLCTDSPAFLVNHVGRGFVPESQRILTENIAPPPTSTASSPARPDSRWVRSRWPTWWASTSSTA